MALDGQLFERLSRSASGPAWSSIVQEALEIASKPLIPATASSVVTTRDRDIGDLDHFISTSGWDLWGEFAASVECTADRLSQWWMEPYTAKAVLILDGLSLRELPWLVQGAEKSGFQLHTVGAFASELPGETNEFARAIGFSSRSQLQDNGGAGNAKLSGARTECVGLPWRECAGLLATHPGQKHWFFWHEWPDSKVHAAAGAGQGLDVIAKDAAEQLTSNAFWDFITRLSMGRRVVITSDHGYAATGLFHDAAERQADFLKSTFKSGRSVNSSADVGPFVPPVALRVNNAHGDHLLALGRWKWRSQGGYPTLAHGGLSLLEVLCPFIEISKPT